MIVIRRAAKRDYPEILKIMDGAADDEELEGFVPPPEITQKFLVRLESELELLEHGVLVAEWNQKPVGFVFFTQENRCLEIEEIDVLRAHQRKGVGKALVNEVERITRCMHATLKEYLGRLMDSGCEWGSWILEKEQTRDKGSNTASSSKLCNKLLKFCWVKF